MWSGDHKGRTYIIKGMETKEPATTYYSKNMVNALKRNIRRRVDEEDDPKVLSEISRILDKDKEKETFEERYQRAKEFAYSRFDEEYARELEGHNFYIDAPMPLQIISTQEELDRLIEECEKEDEQEGCVTHAEMMKEVNKWLERK